MASRVTTALAGGFLALFAVLVVVHHNASADQRLQNGGFESGSTGWAGSGFSTTGCVSHAGVAALNLSTSPASQTVLAQQTIPGPFGPGNHTLSGFYKVSTGAPSITVGYTWRTSTGDQPPRSQTLGATPSYVAFTLNDSNPPANATALVVKLTVSSSAASTVCFDDLSLEAPPPPPPTPIPSPTLIPTLSPTATATATRTATSTSIASAPTSVAGGNSAPPTSTAIGTVATSTPTPTPPTAATGSQLINGNFEQGISGWQHYAGDFGVTGSPVHGGSLAGQLSSATTSTKWAFQIVGIDPAKAYEFSGYVRPANGIKLAYLRISWYEAADAGGSAISSDDSSKLSGGGDYSYLTTGGIAPPANAHSARLKVMLGPQDASAAIMFLDDFSFSQTAVSSAKAASKINAPDDPVETPTATATSRPADATSTAAAQATSADAAGTPDPTSTSETPKEATASAKAAKTSTASAAKSSSSAKSTSTPKKALTAEVAGARTDKTPEAQGGADPPAGAPEDAAPTMLSPDPDHRSKIATVALGVMAMIVVGVGAYYFSSKDR